MRQFFIRPMCHNIIPSTIIVDDRDQYFKKQFNPKFFTMPCVKF